MVAVTSLLLLAVAAVTSSASPVVEERAFPGIQFKFKGKCVDLAGGSTANGNAVQLWDCSALSTNTETNQRWILNNNGPIRSSKGPCIDAGNNPGNGTPLKVWQCYNNYQPQTWVNHNGGIRLLNTNLCIDVPGGDNRNGARLQLWQCTGSDNQRVSF
ncbi:hypothetical protein Q8F55_004726 [Vanrija albida]|uniref:Ricin B lectin domain-containing protein n=1 Tax=Vanrija albida TaxID=181172 RepID=A0ABR3PZX5_9TREE